MKLEDYSYKNSEGFHETHAQDLGHIKRETKKPVIEKGELIFSGPHFYVANPYSKTPRSKCIGKADYDTIDFGLLDIGFCPRTNYVPNIELKEFIKLNAGIDESNTIYHNYKVGFSKMLNVTMERTLQPAILPKNSSHINSVISTSMKNQSLLVEFAGLCSSLPIDFFVKTLGASNLVDSRLKKLPLGIEKRFKSELLIRTLMLNCVDDSYSKLYDSVIFDESLKYKWSKIDTRLKSPEDVKLKWSFSALLHNWYERRQALVEIDVITAMALGLALEEMILIYNVQFPVLQQNEDDTWYDASGNIVFSCSKGLSGVGVDRPVWNTVKDLKAGETYEHTIEKSELYYGKKVIYHAPFDKCDRVEDYKVAWAHFEGVFKTES